MKKISILSFISMSLTYLIGGGVGTAYASTINICPDNGNCQSGNTSVEFKYNMNKCMWGFSKYDVMYRSTDFGASNHSTGTSYSEGPKNFIMRIGYYNPYDGKYISAQDLQNDYRCGGILVIECSQEPRNLILTCSGGNPISVPF